MLDFDTVSRMTERQIDGLKKQDLLEICKYVLKIKRYSSLKKSELVKLVFSTTNMRRNELINNELELKINQEKVLQKVVSGENTGRTNVPTDVESVVMNLVNNGHKPYQIARELFNIIKINSDNKTLSIANNYSKKLENVLKLKSNEINKNLVENSPYKMGDIDFQGNLITCESPYTFTGQIYEFWKKECKSGRDIYQNKVRERLITSTKIAKNGYININPVIEWAIDQIENGKNIVHQSLAFSILTGRRRVEVFGTTEYFVGNVGIICKGLAKKKDEKSDEYFEILPLYDKNKLVDFINNHPKRGFDETTVARNINVLINRNFPMSLRDLGIDKYKTSRDFYASVLVATFDMLSLREPLIYVSKSMGHEYTNTLSYYRKFDCDSYKPLEKQALEYTNLSKFNSDKIEDLIA